MPTNDLEIQSEGGEDTDSDVQYLKVPVRKRDLGQFISGLLGIPHSLERRLNGQFFIDHQWATNLHHLVVQRVEQQNQASLIDFSARIGYARGLVRTITSFDAFEAFHEPQDLLSTTLELRWNFLVYFPSKAVPEKQSVMFRAQAGSALEAEEMLSIHIGTRRVFKRSGIEYRIDSTERTWADDIERIIEDHAKKVIVEISYAEWLFSKTKGIIAGCLFGGSVLIPMYVFGINHSRNSKLLIDDMSTRMASGNIEDTMIAESLLGVLKIQYLTALDNFFLIGSVIVGGIIAISFAMLSERDETSFVLLTDRAKREKQGYEDRSNRRPVFIVGSLVLAVVTGIMASFLYDFMTTF